jgi:hypothetical protein
MHGERRIDACRQAVAATGKMATMSEPWMSVSVADVRTGDRVRLATGQELLVSRIEANFLGRETMIALIEDTPLRWFKQPVSTTAEVEIQRPS